MRDDKLITSTKVIRGNAGESVGAPPISDCQIISHLVLDPINVLLVGVPLLVIAVLRDWGDAAIFSSCFVGLVPWAKLLGDATEHLAENLNQTIGGLLNATFGNAVEMIITLNAINGGKLDIVKQSLLGSILSNLLLVLGMALFAGGLTRSEQKFRGEAALVNVTMLFVGVMSFSLPTVFGWHAPGRVTLKISRLSAIFVGIGYVLYLVFQLRTHAELFEDDDNASDGGAEPERPLCENNCGRTCAAGQASCCGRCGEPGPEGQRLHDERCVEEDMKKGSHGSEEKAVLGAAWALVILLVCTVVVAAMSGFMVHSIEGLVEDWAIPQAFVGVVLLPIVGNACEHASAVRMALHNKVATAIAIAVGSSTQIAMLVMPFSVLYAWVRGQPLDLDLHPTGLAVLFLSVLVVFSVVMDAKSNWLEGAMLVLSYCLVGVLYFCSTESTAGA